MRICIIGKFPPIQGGVSMRTYWSAHRLAALGHDVHVVTNAKEARAPFRMHMRAQDWEQCEAVYEDGSVTVHWTDPVDRSQSYIPMASPFVSKLASMAARAHSDRRFDAVFSHYLEPYGVAGHLAAQMAAIPHVVRLAGSDAGRLWRHPQLEPMYDHVLRSAAVVIATGEVAERAIRRGVDPHRISAGGGFAVPEELFAPAGPVLDLSALRAEVEEPAELRELLWGEFAADRPYLGVYGKLGESKGSFALLAAMDRLKRAGLDFGLVALAHGQPAVEERFRARARTLGLSDRILQIPFLPHWRVPEFLRGCLAVCCLEQDFPIGFHSPIIPREVLLCGACLVASSELIRKLPDHGELPHGYGCVAVDDVNDIDSLAATLAAIVRNPAPTAAVGTRGRNFALKLQRDMPFARTLERILRAAAGRQMVPSASIETAGRFQLTRLAAAMLGKISGGDEAIDTLVRADREIGPESAQCILAAIERNMADGKKNLGSLARAIETEITIATAEDEADETVCPHIGDPLYRLRIQQWAMGDDDLARLIPIRDPRYRVLEFEYDVSELVGVTSITDLPAALPPVRSYIVAFGRSDGGRRDPLMIDGATAQILLLCDGTRTAAEIAQQVAEAAGVGSKEGYLGWIEHLFVCGLIALQERCLEPTLDSATGRAEPDDQLRGRNAIVEPAKR